MKAVVQGCLRYLGYELRRVDARAQGSVPNAIEHNSRAARERFYEEQDQVEGYLSPARMRFYRDVVGLLERRIPELSARALRIADYGCGPGMLLRHLSEASPRSAFHGYDFADAGLRVARRLFPAASYAARDIHDVHPDRYDVIVCTEVLEHLERPHRAVASLLGQLAPGGCLLLTVPDGRIDQYAGHIHFWSPESWRLFLEDTCPGRSIETGRMGDSRSSPFLHALVGAARASGHAGHAEPDELPPAFAKQKTTS